MKNVVITGEGIVSAIGLDKQSVLCSLKEKRTGVGAMHYLRSEHKELPVGEVKLSNEEIKAVLGIESSKVLHRTSLLGMLAVKQALADGCVIKKRNRKIFLISGTTVGGMDITESNFLDFQKYNKNLPLILQHDCGSSTKQIADYFKIFDDYTTPSTACSSATNAIILGANLIKAGEADIVIAGGSEALTKFHLNGFNSLMILDKEQCRPFDAKRNGLNLGEGAAYVVLESEDSARERGVPVHAYLTGYANACDAFHQTATSPEGQGAFLAMSQALEMANLQPRDIQYINAHGTGTQNNDASEGVAIRRLFGDKMPLVSSTKSFTGHTTSASGSIEAVICILAMQNEFVPANLGFVSPSEDGIVPTSGEDQVELCHVMSNAFGFGGNDSSIVLSLRPAVSDEREFGGQPVYVHAKVEINKEDDLQEIRNYVKPLEVRRMGKIMKSSLLSSFKSLEQAGITTPDAIIIGTALGCLENSEIFLQEMCTEGESLLKPTLFMQSTHNTVASNIAIKTKCHGYNATYVQGVDSLKWAVRDAKLLLRQGKVKNVLVGCHDESAPWYQNFMQRLGMPLRPDVQSVSMILTTESEGAVCNVDALWEN
ncbi:MAG: beta-ketoacyl-[acyl-carrier-protein] synthase family protein [Paludibacteraceae bacterium]|nr:beta-ketoacyl-[acyl-carrier-protein] synthase family protein [Paludibacteraceae bacterium]